MDRPPSPLAPPICSGTLRLGPHRPLIGQHTLDIASSPDSGPALATSKEETTTLHMCCLPFLSLSCSISFPPFVTWSSSETYSSPNTEFSPSSLQRERNEELTRERPVASVWPQRSMYSSDSEQRGWENDPPPYPHLVRRTPSASWSSKGLWVCCWWVSTSLSSSLSVSVWLPSHHL